MLIPIVILTIVFLVFSLYEKKQKEDAAQKYWREKTAVVVASRELEPGTIIDETMLKIDHWERRHLRDKDTTEGPNKMLGRVALRKIYKGEALSFKTTGEKTEKLGLSYIIPKGMRAVSLPVPPQNMHSALIKPGDHVDVIIGGGDIKWNTAPVVIQDVEVLAVVQDMKRELTDTKPNVKYDPNVNSKDRTDKSPWVVTLAMKIEDAQRALLAADEKTYASLFGTEQTAATGIQRK